MTEAEWFRCASPLSLLDFLTASYGRLSPHKLQVFACHCCRNILHPETEPEVRAAVRCLEDFSFSGGPAALEREAEDLANRVWIDYFGSDYISATVWETARLFLSNTPVAARATAQVAAEAAHWRAGTGSRATEQALQATWIRDIFPSPYRPKYIDKTWFAWNGGAAKCLAQRIDNEEDYALMPILADALQEAGCECEDILHHCRNEALTHVRGCWVVDLVLGKS